MVLAAEIGTGDGAGVILGEVSWCLRYYDVMITFLRAPPGLRLRLTFCLLFRYSLDGGTLVLSLGRCVSGAERFFLLLLPLDGWINAGVTEDGLTRFV